jgi:hypothetical protein
MLKQLAEAMVEAGARPQGSRELEGDDPFHRRAELPMVQTDPRDERSAGGHERESALW